MAVSPVGSATSGSTSSSTTHTKSITVASPTNYLVVFTMMDPVTSGDKANGVTFNGVAMTEVAACDTGNSSFARVQAWVLADPDITTGDVVVTWSASQTRHGLVARWYSGVDTSDPYTGATFASTTGTTPSVTVTSATGQLVIDGGHYQSAASQTVTVGAGQSEEANFLIGQVRCFASSEAGAASVTMSWTGSSSQLWKLSALALKPATDTDRRAIVSFAELEVPTAPRRAIVSFAELEAPDAPRRGIVSFAEFEVPSGPRRAIVSFAEFEVPTAPRRALVTFAELEVPTAPRRAIVTFAELETPDAPRRAIVTFAELEVPAVVLDRRAIITFAEFEAPNAPRRAIVTFAEFQVPSVGEVTSGGGGPPPRKRRRRDDDEEPVPFPERRRRDTVEEAAETLLVVEQTRQKRVEAKLAERKARRAAKQAEAARAARLAAEAEETEIATIVALIAFF